MKEKVSIVKVDEAGVEAATRRAISLAGGLVENITSSSKVLVKPNLSHPEPSGTGIVTDCRVTEAVTKIVLELGAKSVIIGEGSAAGYDFGLGYSTEQAFQVSGTAEVAHRLGVELRNLNRDKFEEVTIRHPFVIDRVRIARTALESDLIISVPVVKTHIRCLVTLSLKNMKGVMPGAEKRKTHRLGLDLAIADLNSVVRPGYVVVDGLVGMQGTWEYPRDCCGLGLIMAGRDPVAVDTVVTCLLGFDPAKVMHLQYFARRQGGIADLSQVQVVGGSIEEYQRSFMSGSQAFRGRYPEVTIIEGESACTGCTGELMGALSTIKYSGCDHALQELTIVLGNPTVTAPTTKTVFIGKCTQDIARSGIYVKGCPPRENDIIRAIGEARGIDAESIITKRALDRQKRWESARVSLEK